MPADPISPTAAAIAVFDEHGYDAASVDQLAEASGISRSTFFRRFRSKEEMVFADHEALLASLRDRLATDDGDPVDAVCDAATEVYRHHLALAEVSKARYRLVRGVPALRDRELVTALRYEALFAHHLAERGAPADPDLAAACAAAVVAVHNLALRSWLAGEPAASPADLRRRLGAVAGRLAGEPGAARRVVVVGVDAEEPLGEVVERVRRALD